MVLVAIRRSTITTTLRLRARELFIEEFGFMRRSAQRIPVADLEPARGSSASGELRVERLVPAASSAASVGPHPPCALTRVYNNSTTKVDRLRHCHGADQIYGPTTAERLLTQNAYDSEPVENAGTWNVMARSRVTSNSGGFVK